MDTPSVIRIVMADDHRLFLDGLRRLFDEQPDLSIAGTATNGAQAIHAVIHEAPDILLIDIDMPDLNAFAVADQLKNSDISSPRIILLTMHNETPYLLAASRPDIQGYVLKDTAFDELVTAIRTVHAGGRYISQALSQHVTEKSPLTDRELEILQCAANGMTTQETGNHLGISTKTVETHRSHIISKLNVPNITRAVHIMFHHK